MQVSTRPVIHKWNSGRLSTRRQQDHLPVAFRRRYFLQHDDTVGRPRLQSCRLLLGQQHRGQRHLEPIVQPDLDLRRRRSDEALHQRQFGGGRVDGGSVPDDVGFWDELRLRLDVRRWNNR